MHRKVLNSKTLIQVGDGFGNSVDYMGNFVGNDEFDILCVDGVTLAASWSPMKSPSLILMGPNINSTVVCAFLKSG